jgi:hypothetical protein
VMEYWVKALAAAGVAFSIAYVVMLADAEGETSPPLQDTEYNQRLDRLDRKGVEGAYTARVGLLFQNWMTDTNQASQERALKGHRNAREIYVKVMRGIDARGDENAADGFKLQSETSTPFTLPQR